MFVQSHIQRNRHPPGTTSSATAVATSSHQQHHRSAASHHHQHHQQQQRQNTNRQHQQRIHAGLHKVPRREESSKRERQAEKPNDERLTGRTSACGQRSNQCNSFFNQHIDQEELIHKLDELNSEGVSIKRLTEARDDAKLLEQVELVEAKLVAKRTAKARRALQGGQATSIEGRARQFVKSISLNDLNSRKQVNKEISRKLGLSKRSTTINSIPKKSPQSGTKSRLELNEKWTQINGSLESIGRRVEQETSTQCVLRDSLSGVLDLPQTLWNLWLVRPGATPTDGGEARAESGLNLRKNLKVVAWFWLNFIAFQYETLRQIYSIVRATGARGSHLQDEMATSRSEYSARATQLTGLNHEYIHGQPRYYSQRAQHINCANSSIALVGSIEPRLAHYGQPEAWTHGARYQGHQSYKYEQSNNEPNHVHVHNHASLANYYCTHFKPSLVECSCAYDTALSRGSTSGLRAERAQALESSGQPVDAQVPNGTNQCDIVATQEQQQQALATPPESRWQWHLRHTVDGSPIISQHVQMPLARAMHAESYNLKTEAPSSLHHRANQSVATFLERHQTSISSPTLLEPSEQFPGRLPRELPESRRANEVGRARPTGPVEWRLNYSSDELSVISDHEPLDRWSGLKRDIHTSANQLVATRQAQSLVRRRARNGGWSSMDSQQSASRFYERQADFHEANRAPAKSSAANRLVAQSSLTTQHTSSISGVSNSSAASLRIQSSAKTENRLGGTESTNQQQQQQQQQQQSGRRRASPLAKVSLAGAKRRLGFKRRGGGLSSLSVHRSEEVFPGDVLAAPSAASHLSSGERRRQYANTTGSSSLNDSSLDSAPPSGLSRAPWFSQFRGSPDPKVCFVDGLGAGQIASRQALVSPYLGDIQLGLSDRRGMLEVEVIRVRQLQLKPAAKRLPSPYVKVYLMRDKKCLAKFKTTEVRETLDPLYQQQFIFREDYSNCVLQVIVWGDYGKKDKKSLMGAVQIYINDLDMSKLVIGWYKLFNAPSMMNSSLASSSKALRQTMSSSRLATDFSPLPS